MDLALIEDIDSAVAAGVADAIADAASKYERFDDPIWIDGSVFGTPKTAGEVVLGRTANNHPMVQFPYLNAAGAVNSVDSDAAVTLVTGVRGVGGVTIPPSWTTFRVFMIYSFSTPVGNQARIRLEYAPQHPLGVSPVGSVLVREQNVALDVQVPRAQELTDPAGPALAVPGLGSAAGGISVGFAALRLLRRRSDANDTSTANVNVWGLLLIPGP